MELADNSVKEPAQIICIDDNEEALKWRIRLIGLAKHSLIICSHDFRADNSGKDIICALLNAAQRGVKVFLLADGFRGCLSLRKEPCMHALSGHENVQIRIYNQVLFHRLWKANYRMHDKYIICDDNIYLLGGRNTNDLFLGSYQTRQNTDRDILVYYRDPSDNSSLHELRNYFDNVWQMRCSRPFRSFPFRENHRKTVSAAEELKKRYSGLCSRYHHFLSNTGWISDAIEADSITLLYNPSHNKNKEPVLWNTICHCIRSGKHICIQTPYIICSKQMYQNLHDLTDEGIRIDLITNSVSTGVNPFGSADYMSHRQKILDTGVNIYECSSSHPLHTKTIMIDETKCLSGSFNLDMRSAYLDTELMLLIECRELNRQLTAQAQKLKDESLFIRSNGTCVRGASCHPKELSCCKRILIRFLRLLDYQFKYLF